MTRERIPGRSRTVRTTVALTAVVVASAGLLTSCSSSGSKPPTGGSSSSSGATSSGNTVQVKNFAFTPSSLAVAKGSTVTWKFEDSVAHNVTDSKGTFKSSTLPSGGSYSFTFNTAGTYNYVCTIHPNMHGSVTVN